MPRYRPRKMIDGEWNYQCFCSEHNGEFIPISYFTVQRQRDKHYNKNYEVPFRFCKKSRAAKRRIKPARVSVVTMRPYLDNLIAHCGGSNAAARALGVHDCTFYSWLNPESNDYHPTMENRSAAKIINTLKSLKEAA